MKKTIKIFTILFTILTLFTLYSCNLNFGNSNNDDPNNDDIIDEYEEYDVKFFINGELYHEEVVAEGDLLTDPSYTKIIGYQFLYWEVNEQPWDFVNDEVTSDLILEAKYSIEVFNLPIMEINLNGVNLRNINRENYVDSLVSMDNGEDVFSDVLAEFRGRGHGSWSYAKKNYRIKFDKKISLFGEAKSKHWLLTAGGHDPSLIRHNMAYKITKDNLDNILWQTSQNLVELYVNGIYHGVYSVHEHIRVDESRVNINSKYGILDTGYLLEYDSYASEEGPEGLNYFKVNGLKYPFEIKSPDPDDYASKGNLTKAEYQQQVNFIKSYVQEAFDALYSHDFNEINNYFDLASFLDAYIIHELFKNSDTGWSSFYIYKEAGGKLYATSVWDFDLSSGVNRGDKSPEGFYVSGKAKGSAYDASNFTSSELYIELMETPEFVEMFKLRFSEVSQGMKDSIDEYFEFLLGNTNSFKRDAEFWTNGTNTSLTEQQNLYNWLYERIDWFLNWIAEN